MPLFHTLSSFLQLKYAIISCSDIKNVTRSFLRLLRRGLNCKFNQQGYIFLPDSSTSFDKISMRTHILQYFTYDFHYHHYTENSTCLVGKKSQSSFETWNWRGLSWQRNNECSSVMHQLLWMPHVQPRSVSKRNNIASHLFYCFTETYQVSHCLSFHMCNY